MQSLQQKEIIMVTNMENITILPLEGILDGSTSRKFINTVQNLYAAGTRDLLLDLEKLTYISSAGLKAFLQVALLFRGKKGPDREESWGDLRWTAYRGNDSPPDRRTQEHVKLLSPSKNVLEVLEMVGFTSLFEIFTDLQIATTSFALPVPASV